MGYSQSPPYAQASANTYAPGGFSYPSNVAGPGSIWGDTSWMKQNTNYGDWRFNQPWTFNWGTSNPPSPLPIEGGPRQGAPTGQASAGQAPRMGFVPASQALAWDGAGYDPNRAARMVQQAQSQWNPQALMSSYARPYQPAAGQGYGSGPRGPRTNEPWSQANQGSTDRRQQMNDWYGGE